MRSRRFQAPPPSPALAEILAATGELEAVLDGRGLTYEPAEPVEVKLPEPFRVPPPDWEQEQRERQARERQEDIDRARALLEEDQR
jgi:hypothetical protein